MRINIIRLLNAIINEMDCENALQGAVAHREAVKQANLDGKLTGDDFLSEYQAAKRIVAEWDRAYYRASDTVCDMFELLELNTRARNAAYSAARAYRKWNERTNYERSATREMALAFLAYILDEDPETTVDSYYPYFRAYAAR